MIINLFILSVLPSLIRFYSNKKNSCLLKDSIFGIGEDLFVSYQQVVLLHLTGKLLVIPISFLQIYYIVDAFLYYKLGIRLNTSHFQFLKKPGLFFDSALNLGLLRWIPLCFMAPISTYFIINRTDYPALIWSLSPLILFWFCYKKVSEVGHNALFLLEFQLFNSLFLQKHASKKPILPAELIPKSEEFIKTDKEKYPFLKMTTGFNGPLQFEIKKGRPKNIIFIYLESFRGFNVGALGDKNGVTPYFDALSKKGILFNNFYSNGTNTYNALLASLTGVPQIFNNPDKGWHHNFAPKKLVEIPMITIPSLLQNEGYYNVFIDGSLPPLENHGLILENYGFNEVIGKEDFPNLSLNNSSTSWGVDDEYLFDFCLEKIGAHNDKPLFTSIFTISNHHPWKVPHSYKLKNFEHIQNLTYRKFLQTMHYTDYCLNTFIKNLETSGLLDDSLLFIFGDHGLSMQERKNFNKGGKRTLYEEGIHIPFLIFNKNMIQKPKVISDLGSQIDLLPTIMDLLDLKGLNHSIGTSLLRKADNRTIFFNEAPALGNGFALRFNNDKIIIENSKPLLFDLLKDKEELSPINNPEKIQHYETLAKSIASSISSTFRNNAFTPPPQNRFIKAFQNQNSLLSDIGLKEIIKNYPMIEVLDLSNCPLISDIGFKDISENFPLLKMINLSHNLDITGTILSNKIVNWVSGEFTGCNQINDMGIQNISRIAPSLQKLFLSCKTLTDMGISTAIHNLSNLTALRLSSCENLSDQSLSRFKTSCLNHLSINNAPKFTNACLFFLKNQPLYSLSLTNATQITDDGLLSISHLPIEELIIKGPNFTEKVLPALKKFPLEHLILSPCANLSKKALRELIDLNLDLLVLEKCNPNLKDYLIGLYNQSQVKKNLYISFDGTPHFLDAA